jgi:hypothetical protein
MLVTFPSPIPEFQHTPLPYQSAMSQGACLDSLLFHCLQFGFTFESIKELGGLSRIIMFASKSNVLNLLNFNFFHMYYSQNFQIFFLLLVK